MTDGQRRFYRVAIRYYDRSQAYEVLELEAEDLRDALSQATDRFPEALLGKADLVEIRQANPAE
jgi:hypothetical protein